MDENSKVDATTWHSYLKTGTLSLNNDGSLSVVWDPTMVELKSHISEKWNSLSWWYSMESCIH